MTLLSLYTCAGVVWLVWTGRIANAERTWAHDPPGLMKRVVALCVVLVIWPVGIMLARPKRPR